jgi:hypothetical protein
VPTSISHAAALSFRPDQVAAAEAMLKDYVGNEPERVKLALLALAKGDLVNLEKLVTAALVDYRDVLYWAEYPEESKSMTNEEAAALYGGIGQPPPPGTKPRKRKR